MSCVIRVMRLRWERWSDRPTDLPAGGSEEGQGLHNETFVSPRTVHIMCCFSSCHIKIPMWLFWQQQNHQADFISFSFFLGAAVAKQGKQDELTPCDYVSNANGKQISSTCGEAALNECTCVKIICCWSRSMKMHVLFCVASLTLQLKLFSTVSLTYKVALNNPKPVLNAGKMKFMLFTKSKKQNKKWYHVQSTNHLH